LIVKKGLIFFVAFASSAAN